MHGLDILGSKSQIPVSGLAAWEATAVAVGGGALGALLWPSHRVLSGITGLVLADSAYAIAAGWITWKQAALKLGSHAAGACGALGVPTHPVIAYLATTMATALLFGDRSPQDSSAAPQQVVLVDKTPKYQALVKR